MPKPYQIRITAVALALLTIGACVLAGFNFSDESNFDQPTDGAWWVESSPNAAQIGLEARRVPADSPAARAGIKKGDILIAINDHATPRLAPLMREIYHVGIYAKSTYTLLRVQPPLPNPVKLDTQVILEPRDRSINQGFRLIALVYLSIGLYVLFRRWTAPKSTHFYLFCVFSFVLCAFKYTGEFSELDWVIYWSNIVAQAIQPALLLHFAATFTDETEQKTRLRKRALIALIYLPGICLVGLQAMAIGLWSATEMLQHRLDQIGVGYLALYYVISACIFFVSYRRTGSPLRRQQLKWLTRGTILAVAPFTLFYVIPYLADTAVPDLLTKLAVGALVFLPLTFSYAIVRYRLMDVDLIFKRGVTYTLTTAAVVGLYFGLVAALAESVHTRLPWTGKWGLLAAIVITAQLFDPIKRWIQTRVDRLFEQKRYDYRETLIQFGRGITSQTDQHTLVSSIVERLSQTLLVGRIAVFIAQESETGATRFTLEGAHGIPENVVSEIAQHDLGFLNFDRRGAGSHIFLENPQQVLHLPHDENENQRNAARLLDLNYYLPCRVQDRDTQRTIAVIGLGRTIGGDFLSSEDVELLESLASYIGIAIQNARLYSTLEKKITEFERLKEFNENIVESINIGIFTVGLDDSIESWNAQMEVMYALPRAQALRQPLASVFPPDFLAEFHRVKDTPGVHNLYKFRLTSRAGEARIANIAIAPLVTRDFVIVGRILLMEDITGRMELEGQLAQAEKLSSIGLLAAGVAHEVNTPLAVISSYAQMLVKQSRGDEKIAPLLEKITQQTFRASEIVNGLLNFSRTSGTEFTRVDLNQLIHDTLTLLEHQFKTAQVHVEAALAETLPAIHGNQGKLQQVLLNLFLNAKDAIIGNAASAGRGGTLRVSTAHKGSLVLLDIADTGSGISPENMLRIYDPFFTTKGVPVEGQRKGTGLGLAVTYGIIQEHAAKITVESAVGEGTRFHLEFPAMSAAHNTAAAPAAPTAIGTRSITHV